MHKSNYIKWKHVLKEAVPMHDATEYDTILTDYVEVEAPVSALVSFKDFHQSIYIVSTLFKEQIF